MEECVPLAVITREPSDEEIVAEIEALAVIAAARGARSVKYRMMFMHLAAAADSLEEKT